MEGLPASPTFVGFYFWAYSAGGGYTPTGFTIYGLVNGWNETSTWSNTTWSGYNLGNIGAPTTGAFNGIGLTSLYGQWKSGSVTNGGLMFIPTGSVNQVHGTYSSDVSAKTYRPYLYIQYTETVTPPSFKLPLPGSRSWVVTTEIGSWDEKNPGSSLPSHINGNYFSIDFGPASSPSWGGGRIPVYAAAGGKVVSAVVNDPDNGNYVVIDHDYDGNPNTGYTTRYLHFDDTPLVSVGDDVPQGGQLGYMGETGDVIGGVHLHFGIRYNGSGASNVNELSYVKLEGICLKQYQTSYVGGVRTIDSYYPSTNTP